MNTISVTTKNIKPFSLPKYQDLHFILKSMLMYPELSQIINDDDAFTFDKEGNNFILLHYNTKFEEKRPILAISSELLMKINTKELHSYIYEYIKYAWIEKLI